VTGRVFKGGQKATKPLISKVFSKLDSVKEFGAEKGGTGLKSILLIT